MEREPLPDQSSEPLLPIRRIVGLSEDEERAMIMHAKEIFQNPEKLSFEREKTRKETQIIEESFAQLPAFLNQYGLKSVELTPEHVHVVDEETVRRLDIEERKKHRIPESSGGYYMDNKQGMVVYALDNDLCFMERVVHESLHANSFTSFAITKDGHYLRRSGFVVNNQEEERYFHDLNEGIIEELTIQFDRFYSKKMPSLSEAVSKRKEFIDSIKAENPQARTDEISSVITNQMSNGKWETKITDYVYSEERSQLARLIDKIYETKKDEFASREDVFKLFVTAAFTGKLLEIARLIEDSLGKGSFRRIAERTKWE